MTSSNKWQGKVKRAGNLIRDTEAALLEPEGTDPNTRAPVGLVVFKTDELVL